MTQPLIRVSGLSKIYRPPGGEQGLEVRALDSTDLVIEEGEYVAIMGPSGSGKSTLMQILGLLDRATSGVFELAGRDVSGLSDDELAEIRAKNIGFIFQFFNLLPRTACRDNVALPMVYTGVEGSDERAVELLKQVGLGDRLDHKPHQLSGGQQQRVAIARALANRPRLIFADEPTGNISTQQTEEILRMLEELNREGATIVLVTHEPEVAAKARRLLTLRDGKIAEDRLLREKTAGSKSNLQSFAAPPKKSKWAQLGSRFKENVKMAMNALGLNLLRTSLATLGIIIGIASFVAMVAIGQGAKEAVSDMLSNLGTNLLNIRAVSPRSAKSLAGDNFRRFRVDDFEAFKVFAKSQPSIRRVDAQVFGDVTVGFDANNAVVECLGATSEVAEMQNYRPVSGRFFTPEEDAAQSRVVLIGQTTAKNLFGDKNPVGSRIKINRIEFDVIGLLPPKGSAGFKDRDDMVLLPLRTAMDRVFGRRTIQIFAAEASSREVTEIAQEKISSWLREQRQVREGEPDDFDIMNMNDIQELYNQTTGVISSMLQAISFVSLLVGGTGIMNVMFVSVKERTREVGLRKAIGARRNDILMQFLVESVMVCLMGGAFGAVLGWGLSLLASSVLGWKTVFTVSAVATAFIFSFFVGVIFGLWPARQAAELSPIEALRYE